MTTFTTVVTADQVTQEILDIAESVVSGWYPTGPIPRDEFIDRVDGVPLNDGTTLDLGCDLNSPAINKIIRHARRVQRESQ